MNDPKLVKVGRTGHDPGELGAINDYKTGNREETGSGLTNFKRFTSGLDLVYSMTFPFRIKPEAIRKLQGSVDTETPSNGKMLGWDSCFHPIISRQNRYAQTE